MSLFQLGQTALKQGRLGNASEKYAITKTRLTAYCLQVPNFEFKFPETFVIKMIGNVDGVSSIVFYNDDTSEDVSNSFGTINEEYPSFWLFISIFKSIGEKL